MICNPICHLLNQSVAAVAYYGHYDFDQDTYPTVYWSDPIHLLSDFLMLWTVSHFFASVLSLVPYTNGLDVDVCGIYPKLRCLEWIAYSVWTGEIRKHVLSKLKSLIHCLVPANKRSVLRSYPWFMFWMWCYNLHDFSIACAQGHVRFWRCVVREKGTSFCYKFWI